MPKQPEPVGTIMVPTTPGQLLDRITILRIKVARVREEARRKAVGLELSELSGIYERAVPDSAPVEAMIGELHKVNAELWEVEDQLRLCESRNDFGPGFIELARSVYKSNDRRYEIKRQIDLILGSSALEEKVYRAPGS